MQMKRMDVVMAPVDEAFCESVRVGTFWQEYSHCKPLDILPTVLSDTWLGVVLRSLSSGIRSEALHAFCIYRGVAIA